MLQRVSRRAGDLHACSLRLAVLPEAGQQISLNIANFARDPEDRRVSHGLPPGLYSPWLLCISQVMNEDPCAALAEDRSAAKQAAPADPLFTRLELLETVHASPGRVRVRMRGLRHNDAAAQLLAARLRANAGIVSVAASPVTGTVLVEFGEGLHAAALRTLVADTLAGEIGLSGSAQAEDSPSSNGLVRWFRKVTQPEPEPAAAVRGADEASSGVWHNLSVEETLRRLDAGRSGLGQEEAEVRLLQSGPNRLPMPKPRSNWALLWDQVRSVPVLLLAASAGISFVTGGFIDGMVIGAVILINAAIGFGTEKHAEHTIATLTASAEPNALVLRGARVLRIDAVRITPGDIIPLSLGAYIPADGRLIETRHLTVAESALTGESAPVSKFTGSLELSTPLADRRNMIFRGTVVTGGNGLAVVTATGLQTEIGRVHALINEASRPETPLERQLDVLGRETAFGALAVCGLTILMGSLRGLGLAGTLQSAVSLAVAALPEGLPAMATTSLASGMLRMRSQNVLARSLGAVEAAGAIDMVCLDKTGTLTANRMTAVEVYAAGQCLSVADLKRLMNPADRGESSHLDLLLAVCALCSEADLGAEGTDTPIQGSATEVALLELAHKTLVDVRTIRLRFPLVEMRLRAEGRNFMMTKHRAPNGREFVAVKGSPDQVLDLCPRRADGAGVRPLNKGERSGILKENNRLASRGRRVLGTAYQEIQSGCDIPSSDFIWLGLVALADPPRAEASEAIRGLHAAGISTRMITGDQGATAYAIGEEVGLFSPEGTVSIWDGSQDPASLLADGGPSHQLFSRVTPSHKLEIVRALQARGQIVAMTGDGVNDGPALKSANLGVALGGESTETARQSADLVLRDDDLRGLLVAIREGRTIHRNIREAVHFLIATNFSEVLSVLGAIALGFGQPITPRQLLWLNLVTDILPVLALAVQAPGPGVMDGPPPRPDSPLIARAQLPALAIESSLIASAVGASFLYGARRYGSGTRASSMAFVTLSSAQLLHTLLSRSADSYRGVAKQPLTSNYVPFAVAGSFALQILTMATPLRSLLGLSSLAWVDYGVCASAIGMSSLATFLMRYGKPNSLPQTHMAAPASLGLPANWLLHRPEQAPALEDSAEMEEALTWSKSALRRPL